MNVIKVLPLFFYPKGTDEYRCISYFCVAVRKKKNPSTKNNLGKKEIIYNSVEISIFIGREQNSK